MEAAAAEGVGMAATSMERGRTIAITPPLQTLHHLEATPRRRAVVRLGDMTMMCSLWSQI